MKRTFFAYLLLLTLLASCSNSNPHKDEHERRTTIQLQPVFKHLTFNEPVDLTNANDNSNRIFVVEQRGIIYTFANDPQVKQKKIFLDIRKRVRSGGEMGLLGLAFHPDYKSNGYLYVNYTAPSPLRTIIARYQVTSDADVVDRNSELILLTIPQPYTNHNGGQVAFGPDGYLYIAVGDGGSGGDPYGHGQNPRTLLGTILRIDVDSQKGNRKYNIPPDNPFTGNNKGQRQEIFAYGLRNPWRFSFDPVTKKLWTADVGQNAYEEVDIVEKGKNYGWNITEGKHCYKPRRNCDKTGLVMPVWEYPHEVGRSVTGGFVYHGARVPELQGHYIYGDFSNGKIWALKYENDKSVKNRELLDTSLYISSFGVDESNELYVCAYAGKIYRFVVVNK